MYINPRYNLVSKQSDTKEEASNFYKSKFTMRECKIGSFYSVPNNFEISLNISLSIYLNFPFMIRGSKASAIKEGTNLSGIKLLTSFNKNEV